MHRGGLRRMATAAAAAAAALSTATPGAAYKGGVIFLHGSGDSGPNLRQGIRYASRGVFEKTLRENQIKLAMPTAPLRPYTMAGGGRVNVWFDRSELDFELALPHPEHVHESLSLVEGIITDMVQEGVPRGSILLGGFSMGGSLVLESLTREPQLATSFKGAFAMGSFLPKPSAPSACAAVSPTAAAADGEKAGGEGEKPLVPLFLGHGTADGVIPIDWGRRTSEKLRAAGYPLEWNEYEGLDHELGRGELEDLLGWILSRLG